LSRKPPAESTEVKSPNGSADFPIESDAGSQPDVSARRSVADPNQAKAHASVPARNARA
jgi:hypothetical protein